MALPILPIILAVSALGSGLVQGISAVKNAKNEAESQRLNAQQQINERARQAKKLMQEQKTSFLKSGIYFDSGTPLDVINETYDFMRQDVSAMAKDANKNIKNLSRQGKTAFFGSIIEGIANAGMSFFMSGGEGLGLKALGAKSGTTTTNSLKSKLQNIYQSVTGKYKGGFGTVNNTGSLVNTNSTGGLTA